MPDRADLAAGGSGRARRALWVQTIFLGLFAAIGGLIALAVAVDWLRGVATYAWEESTCTVEWSSVADRPELEKYELQVSYRYYFRGEQFTGDAYRHGYGGSGSVSETNRLAARYAAGQSVPCWVDPDEPWNAYLRRANLWRGLWIFVPLLFVALPLGVLYWLHGLGRYRPGSSLERRSGREGAIRAAARPMKTTTGMFILFGAFFLMGFGMLIPFFVLPVLQVVEARSWVAIPCEIVSSGVRTHAGDDGSTYSVEAVYRYHLDGQEYVSNRYRFMSGSSSGYESKAEAVAKIPAGSRAECYVDPDDPYEAVLDRGFGADFLFGLIPLLFGLIGAGGLYFALQATRGAKRDAARPSWRAPTVAASAAALESGPVTLEPRFGPFTKLAGTVLVALFWNGIVSVFLWQLIGSWRAGSPDWLLALFLTPFVLIGLLLLSGVPYSLLAIVNPRPRLRLSTRVLRAGDSAQLDWSFRGASGRIQALRIWLEGTRTETSTSGSKTTVTSSPFRTIEILDRGPGMPVEFGSVSVSVPSDIESSASDVSWKLKLQGRIDYWPDVLDEFEVRVVSGSRRSRKRSGD